MHQLSRLEIHIPIHSSRELVWNTFLNFNRWAPKTGVYSRMQWSTGVPWEKGSRADLDILIPATIKSHIRVLHSVPTRSLRWLFHGNGITCNEGFDLHEAEAGFTQLHAFCDFTGDQLVHFGKQTGQLVSELFRFTFEELRKTCESPTHREPSPGQMHQRIELGA